MRFTPHVTVATVVEHNGRFLLVEEIASGRQVLNQPAGHLDADETRQKPPCVKPSRKPAGRLS